MSAAAGNQGPDAASRRVTPATWYIGGSLGVHAALLVLLLLAPKTPPPAADHTITIDLRDSPKPLALATPPAKIAPRKVVPPVKLPMPKLAVPKPLVAKAVVPKPLAPKPIVKATAPPPPPKAPPKLAEKPAPRPQPAPLAAPKAPAPAPHEHSSSSSPPRVPDQNKTLPELPAQTGGSRRTLASEEASPTSAAPQNRRFAARPAAHRSDSDPFAAAGGGTPGDPQSAPDAPGSLAPRGRQSSSDLPAAANNLPDTALPAPLAGGAASRNISPEEMAGGGGAPVAHSGIGAHARGRSLDGSVFAVNRGGGESIPSGGAGRDWGPGSSGAVGRRYGSGSGNAGGAATGPTSGLGMGNGFAGLTAGTGGGGTGGRHGSGADGETAGGGSGGSRFAGRGMGRGGGGSGGTGRAGRGKGSGDSDDPFAGTGGNGHGGNYASSGMTSPGNGGGGLGGPGHNVRLARSGGGAGAGRGGYGDAPLDLPGAGGAGGAGGSGGAGRTRGDGDEEAGGGSGGSGHHRTGSSAHRRDVADKEHTIGRGLWPEGIEGKYYLDPDHTDEHYEVIQGHPISWPVLGEPGSQYKFTRTDKRIAFDWGTDSPGPGLTGVFWSVHWVGHIFVPDDDDYQFRFTKLDDAGRLVLDGKKVIDVWRVQESSPTTDRSYHLLRGPHTIEIDYVQGPGTASSIQLMWKSKTFPWEVVGAYQAGDTAP